MSQYALECREPVVRKEFCPTHVSVATLARESGISEATLYLWRKQSGFSLLIEALVLALAQQMSCTGVARLTSLSLHRVMAISSHYVEQLLAQADFSEVQ